MFTSSNGDYDIQKSHINDVGEFVVTAGLKNTGILGKTNVKAKIFEKNTITIDMFGNPFFRHFEYKMVTHARVFSLKPLFEVTENQGLFIASSLYYLNKLYGYENMCSWEKIKNDSIKLPIQKDKIDFEFMENFVAELEAQRVAELEAYLKVTGLNNYELTEEENNILNNFETINLKELKISDLFDVDSSKKRFDANKVSVTENIGHPYVVRTALNNGIRGRINEDRQFLNPSNTISFGQDTATMFYQENSYFTGDKIKILSSKDDNFNKKRALYFITSMAKLFKTFSWGASSFNVNVINNQLLTVPVIDDEIDYSTIELLISAIQKLVIKDVVKYAEMKIETTKKVITN